MKISFAKVGRAPAHFEYERSDLRIEGDLSRKARHEVRLEGRISGKVRLFCDRCGAEYVEEFAQPLDLRLSDRPVSSADNLDTIEFLDGTIDLSALLESEVNAYRSAYHYCPKCRTAEEAVEWEV